MARSAKVMRSTICHIRSDSVNRLEMTVGVHNSLHDLVVIYGGRDFNEIRIIVYMGVKI